MSSTTGEEEFPLFLSDQGGTACLGRDLTCSYFQVQTRAENEREGS